MIILLIIIVILVILISSCNCNSCNSRNSRNSRKETFVNTIVNTTSSKDLIISRYNEKLDYLSNGPFNIYNIIVYNKGLPMVSSQYKIHHIANVGRCDHTYLYHIIENYDNLADITIFLPGSCLDKRKKNQTLRTLRLVEETNDSVFIGLRYNDVQNDMKDFKLDTWLNTSTENQEINMSNELLPCSLRPFNDWYKEIFPNVKINFICYMGIFAVSKKHILQHPKKYYENLILFLNNHSNPECGHYFERAWIAVFHPIPESCLYLEQ